MHGFRQTSVGICFGSSPVVRRWCMRQGWFGRFGSGWMRPRCKRRPIGSWGGMISRPFGRRFVRPTVRCGHWMNCALKNWRVLMGRKYDFTCGRGRSYTIRCGHLLARSNELAQGNGRLMMSKPRFMHGTARPVAPFVHRMGYILPVWVTPTTHLLDLNVMYRSST